MLAASEGNLGVVQVLVKAGANLDLQSNVCCIAVCVKKPTVNDPIYGLSQTICTSGMRMWTKSQKFYFVWVNG